MSPNGWQRHLRFVQLGTLLRWHRKGWRLYLDLEVTHQAGPASPECRGEDADRPMSPENPLWGSERIRGELLKLHRRQQPLHPALPVATSPAK